MQRTIQILKKLSMGSKEESTPAVYEINEEMKIPSDEESSLITEEDSSGNPLPPEIIEIKRKNKRLHKNLTTEIMNYKSTSRSLLNLEDSYNCLKSETHDGEQNSKIDKSVSKNQGLKKILGKIINLQSDFLQAKVQLEKNELEIGMRETEHTALQKCLLNIQEEIENNKPVKSQCECIVY